MNDDDLRVALALEAGRLASVPTERLDAPVPTCPEWTVADLLTHVGLVHRWATAKARGLTDEQLTLAAVPAGDALLPWLAAGADELLEVVGPDADLDEVVDSWAGTVPRRWWLRRQAHETAVHRWDADHALGLDRPLDAALAVDGIDELLDVFVVRSFDPVAFGQAGATMHLHATDAEGEWLVRFGDGLPDVERVHAKGDVAVRGPASALLLLLWNRSAATDGSLEVFGERALLDAWAERVHL